MLISCTICSDFFTGNDSEAICCTPCGHLFHYICLMNWFERVQSCPQCRQRTAEKNIVKLYLSIGGVGDDEEDAPDFLKNKVDNLTYQIRLKDTDIKNLKESNEEYKLKNKGLLEHTKNVEDKVRQHETVVNSLQSQVKLFKNQCKELANRQDEAAMYKEQLESLKSVEKLINGTYEEGEELLRNNKVNHDHLVRSLKLFKREIEVMKKKMVTLKDDRNLKQNQLNELELKLANIRREYRNTLAVKKRLEEDLEHAEKEVVKWKNNCLTLQKTNESLMKVSTPKSNLMRRMILEEPAPAHLIGQNLDTDSSLNITTYDIATPSPVQVPKVRPFMSKVNFDEQDPFGSSSQKSTSSATSSSVASSSAAYSHNKASTSSSSRSPASSSIAFKDKIETASSSTTFSDYKAGTASKSTASSSAAYNDRFKASSSSTAFSDYKPGTFSKSTASSSATSSDRIKAASSSISFSDNRALMRKNRFTSDPWENIKIIQQCTKKPDEVYDGLGGHSKVDRDVFPQPKPGPFLLKKKKVSNLQVQPKKKKLDGDLPKISAFLKTYDLTGDDSD